VTEFVPINDQGRHFHGDFRVRINDADARGMLRLDGLVRLLQDIATDDSHDTELGSLEMWVVRRTALRFVEGARWPRYLDLVQLTTWCGGTGAAWAERRTNVEVDGQLVLEAAAVWVPIDDLGHPVRLRDAFFEIYGEVARERKVSGRLTKVPIPEGAERRPWPIRGADADSLGHINNAALWQALSEVVTVPLSSVQVQHHSSVEIGDVVTLVNAPGQLWLTVDGDVRLSAQYELL
jgi:acyl-ACP thioesterase